MKAKIMYSKKWKIKQGQIPHHRCLVHTADCKRCAIDYRSIHQACYEQNNSKQQNKIIVNNEQIPRILS